MMRLNLTLLCLVLVFGCAELEDPTSPPPRSSSSGATSTSANTPACGCSVEDPSPEPREPNAETLPEHLPEHVQRFDVYPNLYFEGPWQWDSNLPNPEATWMEAAGCTRAYTSGADAPERFSGSQRWALVHLHPNSSLLFALESTAQPVSLYAYTLTSLETIALPPELQQPVEACITSAYHQGDFEVLEIEPASEHRYILIGGALPEGVREAEARVVVQIQLR